MRHETLYLIKIWRKREKEMSTLKSIRQIRNGTIGTVIVSADVTQVYALQHAASWYCTWLVAML
jgi:hypothetical protein